VREKGTLVFGLELRFKFRILQYAFCIDGLKLCIDCIQPSYYNKKDKKA